MTNFLSDLRYAVRTLAKSRGFTVVAVAMLALGVDADTAILRRESPRLAILQDDNLGVPSAHQRDGSASKRVSRRPTHGRPEGAP